MTTNTAELLDGETKRDARGRKITSPARKAELVEAYRSSGMTLRQFAQQEGLNWMTLAKWSQYLKTRARPAVRFTEVKMGFPVAGGWPYEVTLPNGTQVRAGSAGALAELLKLVQS